MAFQPVNCATPFPSFTASSSQASWDRVASICCTGRSWASHPLKPPSKIITRCLEGQLLRYKLATLLLWFPPAETVAFERVLLQLLKSENENVQQACCYNMLECIQLLSAPCAPNIGKRMPLSAGAGTPPHMSGSASKDPWLGHELSL